MLELMAHMLGSQEVRPSSNTVSIRLLSLTPTPAEIVELMAASDNFLNAGFTP